MISNAQHKITQPDKIIAMLGQKKFLKNSEQFLKSYAVMIWQGGSGQFILDHQYQLWNQTQQLTVPHTHQCFFS